MKSYENLKLTADFHKKWITEYIVREIGRKFMKSYLHFKIVVV